MVSRVDVNAARTPVRTCIGCRQRAAKRELLRLVAGADTNGLPAVVPDPTSTAPGRGAHLHPTIPCFELAERRRAFARALRYAGPGALGLDELREHLTRTAAQPPVTQQSR